MMKPDQILANAKQLAAADRLRLIDDILATVHPTNHDVETQWVTEGHRRLQAWRAHELAAQPLHSVLASLEQQLKK